MTPKTTLIGALAIAVTCASPLLAQDLDAGEATYKKVCRTCHGPTAKGMASFPKLAGNTAEYLTTRLGQYRSGEKLGPNTALMAPHAKRLSDEDITNVATFIATTFE